ncbi:MAG: hypothetical protein HQK51_12475 [Oligoflexia bacterium]|nr:hypothetical protein [Oligoflexia bacterium]
MLTIRNCICDHDIYNLGYYFSIQDNFLTMESKIKKIKTTNTQSYLSTISTIIITIFLLLQLFTITPLIFFAINVSAHSSEHASEAQSSGHPLEHSADVTKPIIDEIQVIGNTKTKRSAILRTIGINEGDTIDDDGLEIIKNRLLLNSQYLLKRVDLEKKGKGRVVLSIEIEDKWSLIPVPMITQSGYYYSRGFLIYESNFLGELATMVPAIAWTNSGLQGILAYKDEAAFGPNSGMKVIALHKSDLTKFQRKEETSAVFESKMTALLISPNYNTGLHVFKVGAVIFKKDVRNESDQNVFLYKGQALQLRYHYNAKKYGMADVYYTGFYVTYNSFAVIPNVNGRFVNLHDFQIESSIPISHNFLNLMFLGRTSNDSSYLYPDLLGGKEGFRGYDSSSLPTYQYYALMLQYQQRVWRELFLDAFYENTSAKLIDEVAIKSKIHGAIKENTVGVGLRYYFKKITIPALVVEYARNLDDKSSHIHFNLGLSL